jgi:L,D-transpeptidase catalytic domain
MPTKNCFHIVQKIFVLVAGLLLTISVFGYFLANNRPFRFINTSSNFTDNRVIISSEVMSRLKEKAFEAKDYVDENGFDISYCFLIDMRLPSGKNRFFIYNLLKDSIEAAGLVTHGKGSQNESGELIFSNIPNSNCTSLGKYKIGKSYNGNFGLSYKLIGLDKTNSKAFGRSVVLHSYCGVPKAEVYPAPITLSEGCPVVSTTFFTQVKTYIEESQAPILLWIYY